jgi:hypothetical protein
MRMLTWRAGLLVAAAMTLAAWAAPGCSKEPAAPLPTPQPSSSAKATVADKTPEEIQHEAQQKAYWDRMKLVGKCLADFDSLKPGMTRKEIGDRFNTDAGAHNVSSETYTHRECPYFKVDVEFALQLPRDSEGRASSSPGDKAISISKPYIASPRADKVP